MNSSVAQALLTLTEPVAAFAEVAMDNIIAIKMVRKGNMTPLLVVCWLVQPNTYPLFELWRQCKRSNVNTDLMGVGLAGEGCLHGEREANTRFAALLSRFVAENS